MKEQGFTDLAKKKLGFADFAGTADHRSVLKSTTDFVF